MSDKNKKDLFDYLKARRLISLATRGQSIGVCPVYYVVDEDFNFYFISEPESSHSQNIELNNEVALAIFDSDQKVTDQKIGAQVVGRAEVVSVWDRMRVVIDMWNAMNPGLESIINLGSIKDKIIDSKVYKVTPQEIKFFNEALYGSEGYEIINF